MSKAKIAVLLGFGFCAGLLLLAQTPPLKHFNLQAVTAAFLPSVTLTADPASIVSGQSVNVTFRAELKGAQAHEVQLIRSDTAANVAPIATFRAIGNNIFLVQTPLGEKTPGTLHFQARALVLPPPPPPGPVIYAMAYRQILSNNVDIAVTQPTAPPPPVRIVSASLVPNGVMQGRDAAVVVEAMVPGHSELGLILRRTDTNTDLTKLSPARVTSDFTIYVGRFSIHPDQPGTVPLQVAANVAGAAPVVFNLALAVEPAQQNTDAQTFRGHGLTVAIPPGWQVHQDVFDAGGPIALTNFSGAYDKGGLIPTGGATIDVVSVPAEGVSSDEALKRELQGAERLNTGQVGVNDFAATRATFEDTYSSDLRYSNVAVYLPRGSLMYKFYLSFRAGDSRAADFNTAFERVLSSVRFAQEQ